MHILCKYLIFKRNARISFVEEKWSISVTFETQWGSQQCSKLWRWWGELCMEWPWWDYCRAAQAAWWPHSMETHWKTDRISKKLFVLSMPRTSLYPRGPKTSCGCQCFLGIQPVPLQTITNENPSGPSLGTTPQARFLLVLLSMLTLQHGAHTLTLLLNSGTLALTQTALRLIGGWCSSGPLWSCPCRQPLGPRCLAPLPSSSCPPPLPLSPSLFYLIVVKYKHHKVLTTLSLSFSGIKQPHNVI